MYRQGLGDCFLLTFGDTQPHHLLMDCGVILGTKNPAAALRPVAEDIAKVTGGKIGTLVITHEHLDHLWGFHDKMAGDIFDDQITFERLWMAWTEDPKDQFARELRKSRDQMEMAALHAALRLKDASTRPGIDRANAGRFQAMAQRIEDVLGFRGIEPEQIAAARKTTGRKKLARPVSATTEAFEHLKKRIADKTYFQPGTGPFPLPGVDDVRFYVLGPPRNAAQLHKSAANKSDDVFELGAGTLSMADSVLAALATHGTRTDLGAEIGEPFEPAYRRRASHSTVAKLRKTLKYDAADERWRQIEDDWLATGEELALDLDSDTNNTSLVLAFEFVSTTEVLLFVADAQLGNWYSWDEYSWQARSRHGEMETLTATDLLRRAIFYKVGHYGSHNATLREKGVGRMTSGQLVAMMPVDENVAHNTKHWMRMPLPSLCDWLQEKCACFIRLDQAEAVQGQLNGRVQATKLFVDYFV